MYDLLPKAGVGHFRKIVAGKQLWNYDNLEPTEKKWCCKAEVGKR